ncbi:MAG: NAD(P)(+) transhydrogenase (Re/Si-specific) subunit alpha, partial [Candidatus Berkiella sp.]
ESLGAKMVNIDITAESTGGYARELTDEEKQKQQSALADAVAKADVVITTALIPGKSAPKIISKEMVRSMKPGSVIVDTAAIAGGNCEATQPDKTILFEGIHISGPTNLASMVAQDASAMYAKNLLNFLALMINESKINLDWNDEIIAQSVLTHAGEIKHEQIKSFVESNL